LTRVQRCGREHRRTGEDQKKRFDDPGVHR
jgi:hypothetical protein